MTWQSRYRHHLRSRQWHDLKWQVVRLRGRQCERCGVRYGLSLHHKHYKTLGAERPSDVELLCAWCHYAADRQREWQNAELRHG